MSPADDSSAVEHLLRHSDWLRALARRLCRDESLAEDLVQDTWLAALRNPPEPGRSVRAWLTTVGRRIARQSWRKEERSLDALQQDVPEAPAADFVVARIEQERRLAGLVLELDEPYRDAVLQRFYRGLSAARIAQEQGIPAATVRTRVRRALGMLRERLDDSQGGDGRAWLVALAPLLHDTGNLAGQGAMVMGTKGIAISVVTGALCALAVTEGALPLLREEPVALRTPAASPVLGEPAGSATSTTEKNGPLAAAMMGGANDATNSAASRHEAREDPAELRKLLDSASRLDQVRAITLLLQQDTPEARRLLLDAFFDAKDPLLVKLLEEALLTAPTEVARALVDAYDPHADLATLQRLSGILPKLAQARPELAEEIVDAFVSALDDATPGSESLTSAALLALGPTALGGLGQYIDDPESSLAGTGSAAWILSQLPPEQADALRAELSDALTLALPAPDDAGITEEQRAAAIQKAGSLVWAAGLRPPEEHDQLGENLLEHMLQVRDPAQAGTLGWGLTNLKGLTGGARVQMTESLLGALGNSEARELDVQYVRLIAGLAQAQPLDADHDSIVALIERAQALQGSDAELAKQLEHLAAELRKKTQ